MNDELQRIKKHLDQLIKHNQNLEKNMEVLIRNSKINEANRALDGWVFIEEIINMLGVSRSSVYRFIEDGLLPFSKFGSRLIFKVDDVLEIINRNYKRFDRSENEEQEKNNDKDGDTTMANIS